MKHLTDETFEAEAIRASRPVLVDFTAEWCPPCHAMKPSLAALDEARADVDVVVVDVEESPRTAERYGVRAMPTLILLREGKPVAQLIGAQSRARLDAWLDQHTR